MAHPLPQLTPSAPVVVDSDVEPLRTVVVHRPGVELSAVTAANAARLLFDDAAPLVQAQAEHDELTAALRADGAEVLELSDLAGAALAPRPNRMFVRDAAAVLGQSLCLARPATAVRAAEAEELARVLAEHPRFSGADVHLPGTGTLEGGDLLALGSGVVVVRIGERTGRMAAERLAARLLATCDAVEVVLLFLPPGAPFHLDLVLTMVDHATVVAHTPTLERASAIRLGAFGRRQYENATAALEAALRIPSLRVIPAAVERHGRTWDLGVNVVATRPGRVVAFAENRSTNARLRRAGIDVITVPGVALARGRGGPHCLTCPLVRG
jgi:arginine deiminase